MRKMKKFKNLIALLALVLIAMWAPELRECFHFLGKADAIGSKLVVTEITMGILTIVAYCVWMWQKLSVPCGLTYAKVVALLFVMMPFWSNGVNCLSTQFVVTATLAVMLVVDLVIMKDRRITAVQGLKDVLVRDNPVEKDNYHRGQQARNLEKLGDRFLFQIKWNT